MFTVYCDKELIFHPDVDELKLIEPKISLELNKSGAFDFKIYPNHPKYGAILKLKSVIEVYQSNVLIFRGRCLDYKLDFYNAKIVSCEGDLGYFNDSIVRPYNFEGTVQEYLQLLIDSHNAQVEATKQFYIGNVTVTDSNNYIVRSDSTYPSTWSVLEDKLIDKLGGYLIIRRENSNNYIDYLEDSSYRSNQEIVFAENLLDVSQFIKGQDIKTAIIPIGAEITDENGEGTGVKLDIKPINDGKDFVYNQEAVDIFGWIYDKVEFTDVTVVENLKRKGEEHLARSILTGLTIELKAVDLSMLDVNIDEFRIFEYIKIRSDPHKLDDFFLVKQMIIDLTKADNNTITVGTERTTFTDKDFSDKNTIKDTITDVVMGEVSQSIKNEIYLLQSLIQQTAESIMTSVSESYVKTDEFGEYRKEVSTQFEQTNNAFNFQFTSIEELITKLDGDVTTQFNEIVKYIRFENGNIILGQVGNELILKIAHNRISFLQGGVEVAYMSNSKLYITDAEILSSLRIGNYAYTPRSNGNLSFTFVGK
ncbi:MAG: phage tail protein [Culicoidibacterales bacterium]